MKKTRHFIAGLLALSLSFSAAAIPNIVTVIQRSPADTGNLNRTPALPVADGILGYHIATNLPIWWQLGTGLTISGGLLSAVKPDWNVSGSILNQPTLQTVASTGQYGDLFGAPPTAATGLALMATATPAAAMAVLGMTSTGEAVAMSANQAAARTAIGAGSAATHNVPSSGNATGSEVVMANDTRLTDTRLPSAETATGTALRTASSGSGALATLGGASTSDLTAGLAGKADTVHTHAAADIVSGTLADARIPALAISKTTGLQAALDTKLTIPAGTTSQVVLGNGTLGALPAGSVTSITAGTGLSGGVITSTGTISMPSTGTAGTYNASVTTDAQGRVTAGANLSINDAPGRALVTTTASTGFQISSTRVARVCYEGAFATTSTIGGPASATVFLETADTNSTTPGDWTTKARQTYTNTITLAVVLNQVQANNWTICRDIPAAKFVRLRSGSISGTASVSINSEQQETLQ